ncbi:hypothetical protein [Akkermansia sp.]|uniref:hypothetical protein n=1 Tax=Akkermansia sp. TaxID=1872421 RepID=UPI00290CAA43|nr:hypothetical protein [Akkermansia sp.]MDU7625897.1 hypothetical protein [Akkermansia sp.]
MTQPPHPEKIITTMKAASTHRDCRVKRGKGACSGMPSRSGAEDRAPFMIPHTSSAAAGREMYQCIHPAMNASTGSSSHAQVCRSSRTVLKVPSGPE